MYTRIAAAVVAGVDAEYGKCLAVGARRIDKRPSQPPCTPDVRAETPFAPASSHKTGIATGINKG